MRLLRSIVLLSTAAAVVLSSGCKPPDVKKKEGDKSGTPSVQERTFLAPVLARKVFRGEVNASVSVTGTLIPIRSRLLRAEEAGRLDFVKAWQEGDRVTTGTLIATIKSDSLEGDIRRGRADVDLQRESLDIGKKSMESSVREFQTIQDLYSRGISAKKDVDSAELSMQRGINAHRQDLINLEKAEASLRTLLEREERLEIFAPFDGVLVARTTLDGTKPFSNTFGSEIITDFDDRLISAEFAVCGIVDSSQLFLRCDVTSRDISALRLGQRAIANIYTESDRIVEGEVVSISKATNQDTLAFQVDVQVENADQTLRPGMFGRVEILTETRNDTIAIDKAWMTRRNGKDVVYVLDKQPEGGKWLSREVPVELGLEGRDKVEVTWGLKDGDAVIIKGFEVLQDRAPVAPVFDDEPVEGSGS